MLGAGRGLAGRDGKRVHWELGCQMFGAQEQRLPFSRPLAMTCHLFLKMGFCSTQHLWFLTDSETFNKCLASCFKMFCVLFCLPYGKRLDIITSTPGIPRARVGRVGVLDLSPPHCPGLPQVETGSVSQLDTVSERHRSAERTPRGGRGGATGQGQLFGGHPSKRPGEALRRTEGLC